MFLKVSTSVSAARRVSFICSSPKLKQHLHAASGSFHATSGTAPLDHIANTEEEIGLLSHGSACWLFNTSAAWCAVRLQFLAYKPHMVKKGVLSGLHHRTPVLFAESPDNQTGQLSWRLKMGKEWTEARFPENMWKTVFFQCMSATIEYPCWMPLFLSKLLLLWIYFLTMFVSM